MEKMLDRIESYWSTRVEGYSEVNQKENVYLAPLDTLKF